MKSSWLSFEITSSDLWLVSGINMVEKTPVSIKNANISRLGESAWVSTQAMSMQDATTR